MSMRKACAVFGIAALSAVLFTGGNPQIGFVQAECFDLSDFAKMQNGFSGPGVCESPEIQSFAVEINGIPIGGLAQTIVPYVPGLNGFLVTDIVLDGNYTDSIRLSEILGDSTLLRLSIDPFPDAARAQQAWSFAFGNSVFCRLGD